MWAGLLPPWPECLICTMEAEHGLGWEEWVEQPVEKWVRLIQVESQQNRSAVSGAGTNRRSRLSPARAQCAAHLDVLTTCYAASFSLVNGHRIQGRRRQSPFNWLCEGAGHRLAHPLRRGSENVGEHLKREADGAVSAVPSEAGMSGRFREERGILSRCRDRAAAQGRGRTLPVDSRSPTGARWPAPG